MTVLLIVIGVFALVYFVRRSHWAEASTEDQLRKWATGRGLEIISLHIVSDGARAMFQDRYTPLNQVVYIPGRAEAVVRNRLQGSETSGRLIWDSATFGLKNIEFIPARQLGEEEAVSPELVGGDIEAQILVEVNRRLDGITAQPNWMTPYDLDGSGHVDEEEWSILRGSIMQEVRGELGDPGVRSVLTPSLEHATVPVLPAPVVYEDDEETHW